MSVRLANECSVEQERARGEICDQILAAFRASGIGAESQRMLGSPNFYVTAYYNYGDRRQRVVCVAVGDIEEVKVSLSRIYLVPAGERSRNIQKTAHYSFKVTTTDPDFAAAIIRGIPEALVQERSMKKVEFMNLPETRPVDDYQVRIDDICQTLKTQDLHPSHRARLIEEVLSLEYPILNQQ